MKKRRLGYSDVYVSEIGFGAWGIGGITPGSTSYGNTDDKQSLRALDSAFERGVTLFDTSNVYGDGHSEELIGLAFAKKRPDVVLSTKFGLDRHFVPLPLTRDAIRQSVHDSLTRLQTDYVDILHLHEISPETLLENGAVLEAANELQIEGKVRLLSMSLKRPQDCGKVFNELGLRSFQVNLSVLDMRLYDGDFLGRNDTAVCGIIARTPLCFGFLANNFSYDIEFESSDHRSRWSRAQVVKWIDSANLMLSSLGVENLDNTEERTVAALRFCLSVGRIASTIPGMLTEKEVQVNLRASELGKFPAEVMEKCLSAYASLNTELVP